MTSPNSFHEVRFPTDIAIGSVGGPERNTEIVTVGSGHEHRNQRWFRSRRRYDAGYGVKHLDMLHSVIAFFEARRGPLYGFRFRDQLDWKSCPPRQSVSAADQQIGVGDGASASFALVKSYGEGEDAYVRPIEKPVAGSVVIAVDGAVVSSAQISVDIETGQIEFAAGATPANGAVITAGYEFDVPVRFASDQLSISLSAFEAGDVPSIALLEIRP